MTKKDYELIAKTINTFATREYEMRKFYNSQVALGNSVNRTIKEVKMA